MKATSVIFLIIFISSCAVRDSYSDIKPGDILLVKIPLVIPADKASIMIQYGKVSSQSKIEVYHPRCWFVSRVIKAETQTIQPGEFRVVKVREISSVVQHTVGSPFASLSFFIFSGETAVEYFTEIDIVSDTQADFNRLICSHWEDPDDAEYLSLYQINAALKGVAKIVTQHIKK